MKLRIYKTYRFKTDPAIDQVLSLLSQEKLTFKQASELSGVSVSTMRNWRKHKTRRPQSMTIEALGRAAGYERQWIKAKGE